MEENKEMLELLRKIEETNRKQLTMNRILCGLVVVMAVCCVVAVMTVLRFLPQLHEVVDQMQTVLGNLEQTTAQLATVDFESMVTNVEGLVATGQVSLEQTMEKLNSLDFKTLNAAIESLGKVVEKLQKIMNFIS